MITIEYKKDFTDEISSFIDSEFDKYAKENNLVCNYTPFIFLALDNGKIIGVLTGNSYYEEVHISDLVVIEEYRNQHIGSRLLKAVEEKFKDSKFKNMNLTTYGFQAPLFYQKCGYEIEYIRKNINNHKLDKYYLVKYFA